MRRSSPRFLGMIPSAKVTVSDQEKKRSPLTADEVRRIGRDKAIAVVGNLRPMLLTKRFYSEPEKEKANIYAALGAVQGVLPEPKREGLPPLPQELKRPLLLE